MAGAGQLAGQAAAEFGEGLDRYQRGEAEPALRHLRRAASLFAQARAAGARDAESLAMGGLVLSVLASCLGALSRGEEHRSRLAEAEALLAELRGIDAGGAAELAAHIASARGAMASSDDEASRLLRAGVAAHDRGALDEAAGLLQRSLARARLVGDRDGEAASLTNLGAVHLDLGDYGEALACLEPALELQQALDDRLGVARTHLSLCGALVGVHRSGEALEHGLRAATLSHALGDIEGEASARNLAGNAARSLGRTEEAFAQYKGAAARYRELGDDGSLADALNNLGGLALSVGWLKEAIGYLSEALPLHQAVRDGFGVVSVENQLATALRNLGRHEEALAHLRRADAQAATSGNPYLVGLTANGLGSVYRSLGRLDEAVQAHLQARGIAESLGDPHALGATENNLGLAYLEQGDLTAAIECQRAAAAIAARLGMPAVEAVALNNIATVALEAGDVAQAEDCATRALEICRRLGDRYNEAIARYALGGAARLGDRPGGLAEARGHLEAGLAICTEIGFEAGTAATLRDLAAVHRALGDTDAALAAYRRALDLVESMRRDIVSDDVRASFFSTVAHLPTEYADLLVSLGRTAQALAVVERGKARALTDLLGELRPDIRAGVAADLRDREQQLLGDLLATSQRLDLLRRTPVGPGTRPGPESEDLLARQQQLRLDLLAVTAELKKRNPRYADLAYPEPWDLERIQRELVGRTVLLEYALGEPRSLLFAVTAERAAAFELPPGRVLERLVAELRDAVLSRRPEYPHGHELYQALLAPAADLIGDRDLLVVPDGALHYLPFTLLLTAPAAGRAVAELPFVVRDRAVSVLPSATVGGLLARETRPGRRFGGLLAAYGDTIQTGPGAAPRLPDTATEVWWLAGLLAPDALPEGWPAAFDGDGVRIRTGATATKDDVVRLTAGDTDNAVAYRFFHVATHGVLDTAEPRFSGLLFSTPAGTGPGQAGPGQAGPDEAWRSYEIFNARIPSELVVLSACETGLGRLVRGEGIVGLSRAFFYAGASALAVSLWKVADASTARLMYAFYRAILAGRPLAAALREAQLAMLAGAYPHPYHWAPFVLMNVPPTGSLR